jgi:hypothetical protein
MCEPRSEGGKAPWDLLWRGKPEEGLMLFRERYVRDHSPANSIGLGVAFMWTKDYQLAAEHFQHSVESSTTKSEAKYGFIGAANWCVENHASSVRSWKAGATT